MSTGHLSSPPSFQRLESLIYFPVTMNLFTVDMPLKLFFPVWIQRLIHVVVYTSILLIVMARQCYVIIINNTYQPINIWLFSALSSYCESCCTGHSYKKMKILFYLFWGQVLAIPVMEPGLPRSPSWLKYRGTSPHPVFMHKFS